MLPPVGPHGGLWGGHAPGGFWVCGERFSWGALQRCLSEEKLHPLFMIGPTRPLALFYDGLSPQLSMGRPRGYWVGFEGVAPADFGCAGRGSVGVLYSVV